MGPWERPRTGPLPMDTRALESVVPARAVLTELARGFLLSQHADPEQAKRFAATFLREQQGPPQPSRVLPYWLAPAARRGVDSALREGDAPPP